MPPRKGRCRGRRWITEIPPECIFLPASGRTAATINITLEEMEAIRLVDLLDFQQHEAALFMGISRKAFWNDLTSARKKIATALAYGLGISISGGSYILRGCETPIGPRNQEEDREEDLAPLEREIKVLADRLDQLRRRIDSIAEDDLNPPETH